MNRGRGYRVAAWAVACAAWSVGASASAQTEDVPDDRPYLEVGAAFFTSKSSALRAVGAYGQWYALALDGRFRLGAQTRLEVAFDAVYADVRVATGERSSLGFPVTSRAEAFGAGNPTALVVWHQELVAGRIDVLGGLALPLTAALDPDAAAPLVGASAMRGQWSPWRYAWETLGLVAGARWSWSRGAFAFQSEVDLGVLVPTGDGDDADAVLQLMAAPMWAPGRVTRVGVRLQEVWTPTASGDNSQLSATPFVRVGIGASALEARLAINLDRPLGFAFDKGGIWSLGLAFRGAL